MYFTVLIAVMVSFVSLGTESIQMNSNEEKKQQIIAMVVRDYCWD